MKHNIIILWGVVLICVYSQSLPENIDYKNFIIGTWEGSGYGESMYITFKKNGKAVIDFTPKGGGKFELPYSFKDERTIKISLFPDNLVIDRKNDDEMSFKPKYQSLREHISVIYILTFKRVKT